MADPAPETNQEQVSPWEVFTRRDFFLLWSSGVAVTLSTLLFTLAFLIYSGNAPVSGNIKKPL